MGNSSSSSYGHDPTPYCKQIESEPGFQIYQSVEGQEYELYLVPSHSTHLDVSYEFRINNKHPQLVDILFAGQKSNVINCTSPIMIRVVTERIPYRLTHLPPQQPDNAVTILREALSGFKDLFKVNGLICVRDSMIGVSAKNKVKVWLNPNFAINTPEPNPAGLKNLDPTCHEREMIHNIIDLINSKAENHSTWRQLIHARQRRSLDTFDQALLFLNQFSQNHKLNLHEQLRNPFNKNPFPFRDENSEIDKLQDLKFHHPKVIEERLGEKIQNQVMSPTFQMTILPIEGLEKKNNLAFADIKNKCINPGSQRTAVNLQPSIQGAAVRQPFLEIERSMKEQTQQHSSPSSPPSSSPPPSLQTQPQPTIFHPARPPLPARIPIQIVNNTTTRPLVSPSPQSRMVSSVPKRFQIKFHYAGQQAAGPLPFSVPTQSILRSNSEPKCIIRQHPQLTHVPSVQIRHGRIEQPQVMKSQEQQSIQAQSIVEQRPQRQAQKQIQQPHAQSFHQEVPISITEIEVNQTTNLVRQPQEQPHSNKRQEQNRQVHVQTDLSPPVAVKRQQPKSHNPTPTLERTARQVKEEVHQQPSYEIRVHEKIIESTPQEDSSLLEFIAQPSPPKKKSSLLIAPEPEPIPRQRDIFKEIVRLAERPFGFSKKAVDFSELIKKKEEKEPGMLDSRESRKGPGSPRNQNSGMGSSIMSKNKLPKVSYKEMRKMLLQTLQQS